MSATRVGPWRLQTAPWEGLGIIVLGLEGDPPADYVDGALLTDACREAFFELVDEVGLVVCRNALGDERGHKPVRGRSSRGRLSQGEYYHHDGCSGPVRPRVVEIRCPVQEIARYTPTAVAPFPETVYAMLRELPPAMRDARGVRDWYDALERDGALPRQSWDRAQGEVLRVVRRSMSAEEARAFMRGVDVRAGAFLAPWTMGESRFIANENPGRTMQHRRAYLEPVSSKPCGSLAKRWPSQELQPS